MKTLQQQDINAVSGGDDANEFELVDDASDNCSYPHPPCPILPLGDFPRKPRTL